MDIHQDSSKKFDLEIMLDATLVRSPDDPAEPLASMFWVPIPVKNGDVIARQVTRGEVLEDNYKGPRYPIPEGNYVTRLMGPGTRITSEKNPRILATRDGYVVIRQSRIFVRPIFEVQGSVDTLVGHIDCEKTVRVLGNVSEGIRIKSKEDIEVLGTVEDAQLEALGRVVVRGGISGTDRAKIVAGGDVYVKFAQKTVIQTPGSVVVEGLLINSDIQSGKKVVIKGQGKVVGGVIKAREGVESPQLGSTGSIKTDVDVGGNPTRDMAMSVAEERLRKLNSEVDACIKDAGYLQKSLSFGLKFNQNDTIHSLFSAGAKFLDERGQMSPKEKSSFEKYLNCLTRLAGSMDKIDQSNKAIQELKEQSHFQDHALVKVTGITYPGVIISIRGIKYPVTEELFRTMFYLKDERVKVGNL